MKPEDRRSPFAAGYRRWYRTVRRRALRRAQLAHQPYCAFCRDRTWATIVDHRQPHRGDAALFWDPANLMSLCKPHHDATKQRLEHGRQQTPIAADGWPESS